ncbi:nuclear transport factor 2 family protein [Peribacillus muralis]|uniref:nuclear transport factor 2 family protein n=1 Tax=Peribacillus muralis TaxID=264697 RepID=UPI003672C4CF
MASEFSLKEQLRQLEEKLLKPEIRTSQKELNQLLADNFFEFGSSGKVLYKDERIGEEGIGEVKMTLSDFEIHPMSEEIVLTTYRIFNVVNKQHSLRSSIWKITDGSWKMIFHQGTNTTPSL